MTKVKPLLKDTYLAFIHNSLGSNIFRNVYAKIGKAKRDIAKDGELSCAVFVSTILSIFKLIENQHATVLGTERDLIASGWTQIKDPRVGAVLVWEALPSIEEGVAAKHEHIGFYIGNDQAISNSYAQRVPKLHHWTYGTRKNEPTRKITAIYWNKKIK